MMTEVGNSVDKKYFDPEGMVYLVFYLIKKQVGKCGFAIQTSTIEFLLYLKKHV